MPYISQEDRTYIDNEIDWQGEAPITTHFEIEHIYEILRSVPSGKVKGAVNYFCSRITLGAMKPESGWSYSSLSEAIGVLRDAADEIQRRLLVPYENEAILQNGDLPEIIKG